MPPWITCASGLVADVFRTDGLRAVACVVLALIGGAGLIATLGGHSIALVTGDMPPLSWTGFLGLSCAFLMSGQRYSRSVPAAPVGRRTKRRKIIGGGVVFCLAAGAGASVAATCLSLSLALLGAMLAVMFVAVFLYGGYFLVAGDAWTKTD